MIAADRGKLQDKIRYVVLDKKRDRKRRMAGNRDTGESRIRRLYGILLRMGPFFMRSRQLFSDMYGQGCQGKTCLS